MDKLDERVFGILIYVSFENGSPTREFILTRGLRQGDPIAPFMFLVVVEGLARLGRKVVSQRSLNRVKVGEGQVKVLMLHFADDTLVVCQATTQDILTVKAMLRCFESTTGMRVNFHKTMIGVVGNYNKNTLNLW